MKPRGIVRQAGPRGQPRRPVVVIVSLPASYFIFTWTYPRQLRQCSEYFSVSLAPLDKPRVIGYPMGRLSHEACPAHAGRRLCGE